MESLNRLHIEVNVTSFGSASMAPVLESIVGRESLEKLLKNSIRDCTMLCRICNERMVH